MSSMALFTQEEKTWERHIFEPVGIGKNSPSNGKAGNPYPNKGTGKTERPYQRKTPPQPAQHPGKREDAEEHGKRITRKIFLAIITVLSVILAAELIFNFLIAPRLQVNTISITFENPLSLSREEIIRLAGLDGRLLYHNVNLADVRARLLTHPSIKDVVADKTFPDQISIIVKPRVPLALSIGEAGAGVAVPLACDEDGVVFQIGREVSELNLPVLSGLKFADLKNGVTLPRELVSFLKDMKEIKDKEPVLIEALSELKFIKKNEIDYEVLIYPQNYRLPVRIGRTMDTKQLKYMLMVLDVVSREGIMDTLKELDFRTTDVVYTTKEE